MSDLTEEEKKQLQTDWAKDMPLLVAHLLGGRYGFETPEDSRLSPRLKPMEQRVTEAISVAKEINRQLLQELKAL